MATTDLYGQYTNPVTPEILGLERQREYARQLMQMSAQPQGGMVSGRYVAPAFTQQLQAALNPVVGALMSTSADKKALQIAERLREKEAEDVNKFFQYQYGSPSQQVEMAGPYGAGVGEQGANVPMPTLTTPEIPRNPQLAYQIAAKSQNPILRQQLAEMLKGQKVGEGEKIVRYNPATGKNEVVAEGGEKYRAPISVDTGSRVELRDPRDPTKILQVIPKSLNPADTIRMQYEGMIGGGMPNVGGAMPSVGAPIGGTTPQIKGVDEKFVPVVMPQYQYNPQLSPKQNQEMAMKFNEKNLTNINNAKDSFDYLKQAAQILATNKPSSGRLENIVTGTREFFGGGGEASKTDAQLNVLAGGLTMKQPRFEGPQGVLDVQLYQKLAGDVGNPNVPIASRLGAIQQMVELQKKYYPNADWESIDILGPVVKKNVLGGTRGLGAKTMSPTEFKQSLAPQDKEAFEWATKNPNDPRSAQIKKRLGVE